MFNLAAVAPSACQTATNDLPCLNQISITTGSNGLSAQIWGTYNTGSGSYTAGSWTQGSSCSSVYRFSNVAFASGMITGNVVKGTAISQPFTAAITPDGYSLAANVSTVIQGQNAFCAVFFTSAGPLGCSSLASVAYASSTPSTCQFTIDSTTMTPACNAAIVPYSSCDFLCVSSFQLTLAGSTIGLKSTVPDTWNTCKCSKYAVTQATFNSNTRTINGVLAIPLINGNDFKYEYVNGGYLGAKVTWITGFNVVPFSATVSSNGMTLTGAAFVVNNTVSCQVQYTSVSCPALQQPSNTKSAAHGLVGVSFAAAVAFLVTVILMN